MSTTHPYKVSHRAFKRGRCNRCGKRFDRARTFAREFYGEGEAVQMTDAILADADAWTKDDRCADCERATA